MASLPAGPGMLDGTVRLWLLRLRRCERPAVIRLSVYCVGVLIPLIVWGLVVSSQEDEFDILTLGKASRWMDGKVPPLPYGSDLHGDSVLRASVRRALGSGPGGEIETWTKIVGGGAINVLYRVTLRSGQSVIVKLGSPWWRGCGKTVGEAEVMRYVAKYTTIPVPRVLAALPAVHGRFDTAVHPETKAHGGEGLGNLELPEVMVMAVAPGQKLKDVLARPLSEVGRDVREKLITQWVGVFRQLRELHFNMYGSFGADMQVVPLATNGGCSILGPMASYGKYAAGKVAMFLPLIEGGACRGDRFQKYVPQLKCLADEMARYPGNAAHDALRPVLLHTDLSIRNILVDPDPDNPRITSVLDWEFAVSGPAEEEFSFPATHAGLSTDDRKVFDRVAQAQGVTLPRDVLSRADHVSAYWAMIVFCHSHVWRDDRPSGDVTHEAEVRDAEKLLDSILERANCSTQDHQLLP